MSSTREVSNGEHALELLETTRPRSNSYERAMTTGMPAPSAPLRPPTPDSRLPISTNHHREAGDEFHSIKWIEFNRESLPILLQNANGPCPLLAIANVLLLRKRVRLNKDTQVIGTDQLISMIAEHMLQSDASKLSRSDQLNYERNISDALNVLDKLKRGMDVNLKFLRVDQFEYTPECIVFDILRIPLYHGWVIDPQNRELHSVIQSKAPSYNQLVEKILRQRNANRDDLVRESLLLEQFLEENRSQLTYYGLLQLNETMRENELAVFFRNNHFSTIWKNQRQLLLLVSDQGYLHHPSIVFETLTGIDNDSIFTDGYGRRWNRPVVSSSASSSAAVAAQPNTSQDRAIALAIHNQQQEHYREQAHPNQYRNQKPINSAHRNELDDSDSFCCTLF